MNPPAEKGMGDGGQEKTTTCEAYLSLTSRPMTHDEYVTSLNQRPIFVVGAPRSGTTLLRFMLCSHPRIYIPPESNFIPRLFSKKPCSPLKRKRAIQVLEKIFDHRQFMRDWQGGTPNPDALLGSATGIRPSTLLNALYSSYARQFGAERWGDKSPIYTGYVDLIAEVFPSAQFIHIIRDGRDVVLSTLEAYQKERFYVDMYFGARTWKERVRKAIASGARLGADQYYELRYEDLTASPDAILRGLCEFLGEDYITAMVEPHRLAREYLREKGRHAPVRQPPTTKSVGRWRREMSHKDQRLFQAVAGDLLDELGYQSTDLGKMTLGEAIRLFGLSTKYNVLETGRRTLQILGVFHPH